MPPLRWPWPGTYPDAVGAILLEDPPLRWLTEAETGFDPAREASRRAWITGLQNKTRAELIAEQRAQTPHWSAAELEPWADAKLQLSRNVLNRPTAMTLDWPATVQQITCPALLITADPAHGAIVSAEDAAALQALVPQLRIAHIAEAGHSIRRDQFACYMDSGARLPGRNDDGLICGQRQTESTKGKIDERCAQTTWLRGR